MLENSIIKIKDIDGVLCAIIIKHDSVFESIQFLTDPTSEFQLGIMKRGPESPVLKHKHNQVLRNTIKTSEFLFIHKGSAIIKIWSKSNEYIGTYNLVKGDNILLIDGYHEAEFNSECQILEVKQGPYYDHLDKTYET